MIVRSAPVVLVSALIALCGSVRSAAGQWVPSAGTGSVTVAVQRIDHTGHRVTDGTLFANGQSVNVSLYFAIDYALTDRWMVSAALPYVFGKYLDPEPPPPFIPFLPVDACRCWNGSVQDFDVTAYYNVANGAFALTPSISVGVPSHDYAYRGEAVVGRRLRELRLAIDAGQRLDLISDRLSVSGQYAYAIVERVLDIPNNRSNGTVGLSFQVASKLSTRGLLSWQRTHGGLRAGSPPPAALTLPGEVNTPERLEQHDRLLRDNSLRLGASAKYQFPRLDVVVSYLGFVDGTDTHAGRAFTVGIIWPFELGQ